MKWLELAKLPDEEGEWELYKHVRDTYMTTAARESRQGHSRTCCAIVDEDYFLLVLKHPEMHKLFKATNL